MISHPVFHDFVKSLLHREQQRVFELCTTIPSLNSSNLFKKDAWVLADADQEVLMRVTHRPLGKIDAVWYFKRQGDVYPPNQTFFLIHEVKTGKYDAEEVYQKYYTWSNCQIWIWAWEVHHRKNVVADQKIKRFIRQPDLEILQPLCVAYLDWFMVGLGESGAIA